MTHRSFLEMSLLIYNISLWKRCFILIKNKKYALELLRKKVNGENKITYREIQRLTSYSKRQLIRLSKEIEKKGYWWFVSSWIKMEKFPIDLYPIPKFST